MPKIARVRLSDGRVARFRVPDDATPEQIKAVALKQMAPKQEERGALRRVDDFVRGVADAATLGYSDEIAAWAADKTGIGGARGDYQGNLQDQRQRDKTGGGERLAGQVVGAVALPTSKLAAAKGLKGVATSVGEGVAYGAGYETGSADGSITDRLKAAPKGAAYGAGGSLAGRAVGATAARTLRGQQVSPNMRLLADEGVVMTPGQRGGKVAKTVEESVIGSIPFAKAVPQLARARGIEQFNVAAYNRVLKPLGITLPKGTSASRQAIENLGDTVFDAYDASVGKLRLGLDAPLHVSAQKIAADADSTVGPMASQLRAIVDDTTTQLKAGALSGDRVRGVIQDLRGKASNFSSSSSANERYLGAQLWKLHDEVDGALLRQNSGGSVREFKRARESVSLFKRVESAAAKSKDGIFSPQQFRTAVTKRGYGTSTGKVATGKAPMQDLSDAASDVLPATIPNSGSPERLAAMGSLAGPSALGVVDPTMGALTALSLGRYIPGVDGVLQHFALNRPDLLVRVGNSVSDASPYLGTAGAMTALQGQ